MSDRLWNLSEITLKDVQDMGGYRVAILPFGATEPHNLHLPYGQDFRHADHVARASCAAAWERAESVLQEGAQRIFDESFAEITARRFEESAYVLGKRDAVESAHACLAAARAFRAQPAADNPVAKAMLEVVLEPALRKLEEETENESEGEKSLLVKP